MFAMVRFTLMLCLTSTLVLGLAACAITSDHQPPIDGKPPQASANQATSRLADTSWRVENIADGRVIDFTHTTIDFRDNGAVTGFAGELRYRGRYRVAGEKLSVHGISINRRYGQPALEDDERHFLRVLSGARGFDIAAGGNLIIHARSGRTITAAPVE